MTTTEICHHLSHPDRRPLHADQRHRHRAPAGCLVADARGWQGVDGGNQRHLVGRRFFFSTSFFSIECFVLIFLIFATSPISTAALARAVYHNEPALRKQLKHDEMASTVVDKPEPEVVDSSPARTSTPATFSPHAAGLSVTVIFSVLEKLRRPLGRGA
jgi:hypothetical protein